MKVAASDRRLSLRHENQNRASYPRLEIRGARTSRRISESVRTRDSLCLGLIAAYWNCSASCFEDARGNHRRTDNRMAVLGARRTPIDSPRGKLGVGVQFDCYQISRRLEAEPIQMAALLPEEA